MLEGSRELERQRVEECSEDGGGGGGSSGHAELVVDAGRSLCEVPTKSAEGEKFQNDDAKSKPPAFHSRH